MKYTPRLEVILKKFNLIIPSFRMTRRYRPLRGPTSSSCGGLWPSTTAFLALRAKKELIMRFCPIFGNLWCPVVTLVTFSSSLSNFERNSKNQKKSHKNSKKIQKIHKSKKNPKNPKTQIKKKSQKQS